MIVSSYHAWPEGFNKQHKKPSSHVCGTAMDGHLVPVPRKLCHNHATTQNNSTHQGQYQNAPKDMLGHDSSQEISAESIIWDSFRANRNRSRQKLPSRGNTKPSGPREIWKNHKQGRPITEDKLPPPALIETLGKYNVETDSAGLNIPWFNAKDACIEVGEKVDIEKSFGRLKSWRSVAEVFRRQGTFPKGIRDECGKESGTTVAGKECDGNADLGAFSNSNLFGFNMGLRNCHERGIHLKYEKTKADSQCECELESEIPWFCESRPSS